MARGTVGKALRGFVLPEIEHHLDFLERELREFPWFAGNEFTAADVQMSFPLEAAQARAGLGTRPRSVDFLERIHQRPAYREALRRGGGFGIAS